MMTNIFLSTLLIAVAATSPPHPIHLSMTEFFQEKENTSVGMSVTLFMDDFAKAINYQAYVQQIQQGKLKPETLMERYLKKKLSVQVNGKTVDFYLDRTETNMDAVTCYFRLKPQVSSVNSIQIESLIFLELFDDQRNMVQIQLPGKKTGMIALDGKKRSGTAEL
ncbi:MAG: DUF6702 family protein [Saprospiraceae bacterium]|jgi:hypothetical protein